MNEKKCEHICPSCKASYSSSRGLGHHFHNTQCLPPVCKNCNNRHPLSKDALKYCDTIFVNCLSCNKLFKTKNRDNDICRWCKTKNTNLERYGVTHNWQTEKVKEKRKNVVSTEAVKEKRAATNLKRYGTTVSMNSPSIREEVTRNARLKKGWSEEALHFLEDPVFARDFLTTFDKPPRVQDVENKLNCYSQQVGRAIRSFGLDSFVEKSRDEFESSIERQFKKKVRDLGFVTEKTTTAIGKYEIDCFVRSKMVGFEINGSYWHSDAYKERDYHLNKTELADSAGIRLIHFFDHELFRNEEKALSIAKNALGLSTRLYARKCKLVELSPGESREFMEKNHLQNNVGASYRIGLVFNDELVAAMTFGRPRFGKFDGIELLRYCSKLGTVVVGGESRLFENAKRLYGFTDVISYCDRSKFTGKGYEKIGFLHTRNTSTSYHWVESNSLDIVSRYKTQMKDEDKTMRSKGYFKVYDCGNKVYEWHAEEVA